MVFGQMNEPPGARLRVALSGLTMAEDFRDTSGKETMIFIDNIFRFTQAGSEVSALLERCDPIGRGLFRLEHGVGVRIENKGRHNAPFGGRIRDRECARQQLDVPEMDAIEIADREDVGPRCHMLKRYAKHLGCAGRLPDFLPAFRPTPCGVRSAL